MLLAETYSLLPSHCHMADSLNCTVKAHLFFWAQKKHVCNRPTTFSSLQNLNQTCQRDVFYLKIFFVFAVHLSPSMLPGIIHWRRWFRITTIRRRRWQWWPRLVLRMRWLSSMISPIMFGPRTSTWRFLIRIRLLPIRVRNWW